MSRGEYEQFRDRLIKDTEWFKRDDLKKLYKYGIYDDSISGYKEAFRPEYYKLCDNIVKDTAEFYHLIEDDKKHK